MKSKTFLALIALALGGIATAPKAGAYSIWYPWPAPKVVQIFVHFDSGEDTPVVKGPLSDGTRSWTTSLSKAIKEWNSYVNSVQLAETEAAFLPFSGDLLCSMYFSKIGGLSSGVEYRSSTWITVDDYMLEKDIAFNANLVWDSYKGAKKAGVVDFYRVALRAVGETFGLGPVYDWTGNTPPAIMYSTSTNLRSLTKDDVEGLRSLYDATSKPLPPVNGTDEGGGGGGGGTHTPGKPRPKVIAESGPSMSVNEATAVSSTGMKITASVQRNAANLKYCFEYDTTPAFRKATKIAVLPAGNSPTVSATLKNLQPGTKYYYRIKVITGHANYTSLAKITATKSPKITLDKASSVKATAARLGGSVTSRGPGISAEFQYDTAKNGKFKKKLGVKKLADSTKAVKISANVTNLAKNKTYYYRIAVKANGRTIYSPVQSFKTLKK